MDRRKKVKGVRTVWRMTTDAPLGEFVDFDPTVPAIEAADVRLKMIHSARMVSWRASSYDLLNGLDVIDQTDSIPGELFDRLFKH